jgi:hypothetical protein
LTLQLGQPTHIDQRMYTTTKSEDEVGVPCTARLRGMRKKKTSVMPPTRIERAIFALQVRRLTTWPRRLCLFHEGKLRYFKYIRVYFECGVGAPSCVPRILQPGDPGGTSSAPQNPSRFALHLLLRQIILALRQSQSGCTLF